MATITRIVLTVDVTPEMRASGELTVHEAILDGDEALDVGDRVLIYDGDVTYLSSEVTDHDGGLFEIRIRRD